jgi:hypothetical protein
VSNIKKAYFIHPFSFNKLVSKSGSVDQERSTMAKKKKKKKKKKEMSEKYEEEKETRKGEDENVLYSQNFRGRGCCRGSRGNYHSGRGRGQEGYYEENGQSSQQNKALKETRSKDKAALYMLF